MGYLDYEAAEALAMSISAFRRQLTGRSRVSRQTARLALYVTLHRADWLEIAELAAKLAAAQQPVRNGLIGHRNKRRQK